ncbi:hypothetical protein POTOM_003517 [Populus tomentosa]|uniref:Uncharacterized protein n=1 Tax=Populus tomentosa TaxID=118781 RepID=A0A8X8DLF4_POPTO|nr:hypothetical protein POTOM_003517 [Populus tomentosa]
MAATENSTHLSGSKYSNSLQAKHIHSNTVIEYEGVTSVALEAAKDQIVVVGEEVDSVKLANSLRKKLTVRYTPRRNSVADRKNHTLEANGIEQQQQLYQVISMDGMGMPSLDHLSQTYDEKELLRTPPQKFFELKNKPSRKTLSEWKSYPSLTSLGNAEYQNDIQHL